MTQITSMKPKAKSLIALAALFLCTLTAHAEKVVAGPKGGRLLEADPFKAEFFVSKDRKVEVTFYDAALKPVAPESQAVSVTAEPAAGRTKLEMEKTPAGFVSKTALPGGEPYRVVVQIRATPEARPQNFRIDLNTEICGGCSKAEYACTCEGH
jgi:hypothetical protein